MRLCHLCRQNHELNFAGCGRRVMSSMSLKSIIPVVERLNNSINRLYSTYKYVWQSRWEPHIKFDCLEYLPAPVPTNNKRGTLKRKSDPRLPVHAGQMSTSKRTVRAEHHVITKMGNKLTWNNKRGEGIIWPIVSIALPPSPNRILGCFIREDFLYEHNTQRGSLSTTQLITRTTVGIYTSRSNCKKRKRKVKEKVIKEEEEDRKAIGPKKNIKLVPQMRHQSSQFSSIP